MKSNVDVRWVPLSPVQLFDGDMTRGDSSSLAPRNIAVGRNGTKRYAQAKSEGRTTRGRPTPPAPAAGGWGRGIRLHILAMWVEVAK
ncbi:hypothetical protein BHM03_00021608 [Ensete ventricosum]|nr:hypothetical protein BHM03_00021608 [Ensete ventricosum]